MSSILGISAFYHDSAAALLVDGEIIAAAQEERFTRKKHDQDFPVHAIEYCLQEAGIEPHQLDYVGFYDKPFLKFDRLLETYLAYVPAGFKSFSRAMPVWLRQKLHLPREMNKGLKRAYNKRYVFAEHHESHAASAFFPSPFEEAAILTLDGVGEWATASFGTGKGNRIELSHELRFPHSLGLLYSAFTYFCGFRVNSGEYKLMGLAPYGTPVYADLILDKLLDLKEDGSFRMDMSYFNYCQGLTMTSRKLHDLFGGPPRTPETDLSEREMNIAASIQAVTEEIMMRTARMLHDRTGMKNLCLAGGVALNCVGNGRILREGPFENIWIQPAAGDAGGALGVALFIWHQLLGNERRVVSPDAQHGSLLGPSFSDEQIESFLENVGAKYRRFDDEDDLCAHIADRIANGMVVGWMQGRMEFGPRALGSRSIIGDARSEEMQKVMNLKIKFRESFRPFAPSVLQERAADYFEMSPDQDSPYMLLVAPVRENKRTAIEDGVEHLQGLEQLNTKRSEVPAITHVDYSARVQTVDAHRHGRYYKMIKRFEQETGCPVIINTSFNVRGEPIVCSPAHAYHCFMATNMDVLVLEDYVLLKSEQPVSAVPRLDEYLAQFQLD
jgi:carbamoyltransferase